MEVLSPSSIDIDREDKFEQYATAGIAHYWIVDPAEKTVEGWSLQDGRYTPTVNGRDADRLRLPPFNDLEIPLKELWR